MLVLKYNADLGLRRTTYIMKKNHFLDAFGMQKQYIFNS